MSWSGPHMSLTSDENTRALIVSSLGGVIGGTLVFIQAHAAPATAPVGWAALWQFLSNCFTGVIAGMVGVVLILNVDRRDWLRTFAIAIICGFSSPKIMVAALDFLQKLVKG